MKQHRDIRRTLSAALLLAAPLTGLSSPTAAQSSGIETVVVTATAPLPTTPFDPDKIAGEIETLSLTDLARDRHTDVVPNLVASQLSSVGLSDEQGSQFQPDFVFRGFEASPISGIAEGIAVYQDGVRLNEAFGDNVNWDLVPGFAVETFTLESNNPVFGLNSLGGAVALAMKSGFTFQGSQTELSSGSWGNVTGNAEYGSEIGRFALYAGFGGLHDDGFREDSRTGLKQVYADLGYRDGDLEVHLSASGALNDIGALGPTPVQMLAMDHRAIFTSPQSTANRMGLVQLRSTWRDGDVLAISVNFYYRHFEQSLVDGNTTDVVYCGNDPAQLCLEGNGNYPGDALFDSEGMPVPAGVLPPGAIPGETDFTHMRTNTLGAAWQLSTSEPFLNHANTLIAGASLDDSLTDYSAYGELGALLPDLAVQDVGVIIDQQGNPTAQPPLEEPVALTAMNRYIGVYAMDVFDVTPALSWTLSARANIADIRMNDPGQPTVSGRHGFSRVDPGTGVSYKFADWLTAFAGFSESNRAPTPGELSCANPASPCLLDAFLVSDPALRQVVSRNFEFGFRGTFTAQQLPGEFEWHINAYRNDASQDIILLATAINGFGYFQNAGTTRRQGIDAGLRYDDGYWRLNLSYSHLDATFRNALTLSSNSPAANQNGLIDVRPGDRLPMNPSDRATLSVDYQLTHDLSLGADIRAQSGEFLVGDDSNQEPQLPGFATVGIHGAWQLTGNLELFLEIENVLDARYYTYGAFTQLDGLPPNVHLTDPRTYSPAPGRAFYGGLRASL